MTRTKSLFITIVISILLVGAAIGAYTLFIPKQSPKTTTSYTKVPSAPVAKKETMLTLPGAMPIEAKRENYDLPTSLWVVVSKDHPLADPAFRPADLQKPTSAVNPSKSLDEQSLRADIVLATDSFFNGATAAGHDLMLASGFRSYELQKRYFDNYARVSGEAEANKYSAHPGESEHQTGLAFDISLKNRLCYLETCFGDTDAGKWLAAHAYEYGFILRYPANKTAITKYQYEPWHFRYVGVELAGALHESGLTLDEAYPYLQTALSELRQKHAF